MYRAALLILAALLVALVAAPAMASHTAGDPNATGCEIAHECADSMAWTMPDGQPRTSLYAWDPIFGHAHDVGAYGLAAFCHNYGGYWYYGDDGGWYWFACSGP
jgi:hypothetical protein